MSKYTFLSYLILKTENYTLVKSEWNWSLTLLLKNYFAFISAPDSRTLLGEKQTYRVENALQRVL